MTRSSLLESCLIIGAMLAASAFALGQVPHDARIAIHFDVAGQPDRFADPLIAFLAMPGFAMAMTVLFVLLPRWEPHAGNLARSASAYAATWRAVILLLAACHALLIGHALGLIRDVPGFMTALLGLFFVATGNVAGKTRPMRLFGVRTPWTLADAGIWQKTHRLYGRASVGLGFALVALAFIKVPPHVLAAASLGGLALLVAGSVAYSWWLWRQNAAH
ncbi:SdpI family protein [Bosea sp. RAF48]|uniref:SdpI family protein n=1 Tax=Bosea sp. RAF48 TaxID=3237480 RepID=UPI003F8E3CBF